MTKIAKKISFREDIRIGEDMFWLFQYLQQVDSMIVDTSICGYRYFKNAGSAMKSEFDSKFFEALELSKLMRKNISEEDDLYGYYIAHEEHERCKMLEYMLKNKGTKKYKKEYRDNRKKLLRVNYYQLYKHLDRKQFFGILLMNISPYLYLTICKIKRIG